MEMKQMDFCYTYKTYQGNMVFTDPGKNICKFMIYISTVITIFNEIGSQLKNKRC